VTTLKEEETPTRLPAMEAHGLINAWPRNLANASFKQEDVHNDQRRKKSEAKMSRGNRYISV